MALILNIDTATAAGSVCLAQDGRVIGERMSVHQKDHAGAIAPFVQEILHECGVSPAQLEAVAISGGPGSYTGLRVAASTAKGLCYAWDIPLIAINTLVMMANGFKSDDYGNDRLLCPMIDARRSEVFTALYDRDLQPLIAPSAVTLDENFLKNYQDLKVTVFGTGSEKAEKILFSLTGWRFSSYICHASHLVRLSDQAFQDGHFQDLAYFEPFYLKSFYHRPSSQAG